jgi:tetratricopeptide (TPR) repeat protein
MEGFIHLIGKKQAAAKPESGAGAAAQHLSLGSAFFKAGMLEDAEREYGIALQHSPKDGVAHSRLALIALKSGRAEKALQHFDALASGGNGSDALLRNRAVALEQLGRFPEALESIEGALAKKKDDPGLLLARGVVRFKNREPRPALESFQRYRKLLAPEVKPPAIYFAYALLAAGAAGDMDQALHLGREGLTQYPGNGPILVNLGVVLERRGEADAAEALYLRAVGETPPVPQAHKNLGDLAYRRGDQAGARAHYERALRLNPKLGDDLYLKLGNLVYKDGDRDWAVQLWKKALELNPGNEVVRTNLELISSAPGR